MEQNRNQSVTWEAPEHNHEPKGADWYIALALITGAFAFAALLLGNILLTLLALIAGGTMGLVASKPPRTIPYAVTTRGIRIDDELYPYSTLESFAIEEEDTPPKLLVKSEKLLMPLLVLPLPAEKVEVVEELVAARLPEDDLTEPFYMPILERLGL